MNRSLLEKIKQARQSAPAMDSLVAEYLPFIRQEASRHSSLALESDDRVSLGMITFVNCVKLYDETRGSFLGYVSTAIRNRLLDEAKKQSNYARNTVPLEGDDQDENTSSFHQHAAAKEHERRQRQAELVEEINRFSTQLADFGIDMNRLDVILPTHRRLRRQCVAAARKLAGDAALSKRFAGSGRLPAKDLSKLCGLPVKTIERCRQYIVAVTIILLGDFSRIESFLPDEEEIC